MKRNGYTLVELIIGTSIMLLLSSVAYSSFRGLEFRLRLESTAQNIMRTLEEAQTRTIAARSDTNYGVHFDATSYTLFPGGTYAVGAVGNEVHELPSGVAMAVSIGDGSDVVFERVRGVASASGTVIVSLTSDPTLTRTVVINLLAPAQLSSAVAPINTRLVDTRHVDFNLGWGIQSATTLRLVFHNPPSADVTEDIPMASYRASDSTSFDWSGVVGVNGDNQTMRIHTHTMTPTTTVLSVHRDRRFNTKAVDILIDGQAIASFAADGTLTTQGSGGVSTVQ
ncbi:MAG: prepilin-type N-terminal cleavage/methylation domain-containing protein [Patescibacteria group bacterium]